MKNKPPIFSEYFESLPSNTVVLQIRDILTFDWIYSFSLDVKNQNLYVATSDGIYSLNIASKNPELYLNVVASMVEFVGCTLFYIDV
jgi:hypothetical protein